MVFVLAGLLLVAIIPPTYASSIGQDLVSVAVGLAYPLLDLALLVVALPILFLFGRGTIVAPLLICHGRIDPYFPRRYPVQLGDAEWRLL